MKNFLKPTKMRLVLFVAFFILSILPVMLSLFGIDISIEIFTWPAEGFLFACFMVGGCGLGEGCRSPVGPVFCFLLSLFACWIFVCFLVWIVDKIKKKKNFYADGV